MKIGRRIGIETKAIPSSPALNRRFDFAASYSFTAFVRLAYTLDRAVGAKDVGNGPCPVLFVLSRSSARTTIFPRGSKKTIY
jgi:hypothetical protein